MVSGWAEVRMSDFNLWVAGVGGTARNKASLDTRLQALPNELATLQHLLTSLQKSLADCRILNGKELDDSREIVDLIIENLAMLATVIRSTGKQSRMRRANQTFDPERQQQLRQHLECIVLLRRCKEGLFRPVDPNKPDFSTTMPNLPPERRSLTPLQERLIDANLRRRYWFLCAQRHWIKLSGEQSSKATVAIPVSTQERGPSFPKGRETAITSVPRNDTLPKATSSQAPRESLSKAPEADLSTTASTVDYKPTPAQGSDFRLPSKTVITTITSGVQYPSPPRHGTKSDERRKILNCPCCCQPLQAGMSDGAWKYAATDRLVSETR